MLALGACGFRLAGSERLPPILARPYLSVKDPYTDFAREFEHQLKSQGALLQVGRQDATATIEVTKDFVEQRTLAVSARNIPTDYELRYTVVFDVKGPDSQLLAPQEITLSKDYSFEENVLLAKEHEADILRAQMARDLATMAMHRLTRLK
jgi:LPS-assembly lipoprotein